MIYDPSDCLLDAEAKRGEAIAMFLLQPSQANEREMKVRTSAVVELAKAVYPQAENKNADSQN